MNYNARIALNEALFVLNRKKNPNGYGKNLVTVKKYFYLIKYLERNYRNTWEKYQDIPRDKWLGDKIEDDCPIWVWWEQGFASAPPVVQACLASIKKYAGNRTINCLDRNNLCTFIEISPIIWEKHDKKIINSSNLSDLIRFALLEKYGGIWLDACDFFVGDSFFKECSKYSFYSAKGFDVNLNITRRLWSDSVFACGKNCYYPKVMRELITEYFLRENYAIDYFFSSCFQNVLYENIDSIRYMFNMYPCNNTKFYEIRLKMGEKFDENYYRELRCDTDIFNLTWKINFELNGETYFEKLSETVKQ